MRVSVLRSQSTCLLRRNHGGGPPVVDVVQGPSLLRTSLDRPNPSLIHLPGLRALPFWTQADKSGANRVAYGAVGVTRAVEHLQAHWTTIRDEYTRVAPQRPSDYEDAATEHKLHQGTWDWHSYMLKGQLQGDFATHFPQTTQILQTLRDEGLLFEGTPFGYSFFSTLHPQSKIAPHTSPMNLRLRVHLPLLVPDEDDDNNNNTGRPACGIQVGPLVRAWKAGQALVLDDAYRHEVWNETAQARVVLLVDLWHPDVTVTERREIVSLLAQAAANHK